MSSVFFLILCSVLKVKTASNAGVNGDSSAQAHSEPISWISIGLSGHLTKSQVILVVIAILLGIIVVILVGLVIRWKVC